MKTYKCDVAVVAGGAAGLSAAVAAAEKGASVIVLEKTDTLGGAANNAAGLFAVETPLQKKHMVAITKEEAYGQFMEYVHFRSDPRIIREYIEKSPDTIAWLEEKGVEFEVPLKFFKSSNPTWLIPKPGSLENGTAGSAKSIVTALVSAAEKLGVQFLMETPAKELIKTGDAVTGVKGVAKDGEEVVIEAGSVIVAAGGFGGNPEMIKEKTGYDWGKNLFSMKREQNSGDGLKMAYAVGAGKSRTIMEMTCGVPNAMDYPSASLMFNQPASLVVNRLGDRILDEEVMENPTFTANQVAMQPDGCAFVIIDENVANRYLANGPDNYGSVKGINNATVANFYADMEKAAADGFEFFFTASSVEELAAKTGIAAERLAESIEEYNGYCATGNDGYFGKSHKSLVSLDGPKYFAAKIYPGGYGSLGGIKINYRAEVMTDAFDIIPGLYSAGIDCCSIYDDSYIFILPGNTMGFAINYGRIAGENAADTARA